MRDAKRSREEGTTVKGALSRGTPHSRDRTAPNLHHGHGSLYHIVRRAKHRAACGREDANLDHPDGDLLASLIDLLRAEGAPRGISLLKIARVRRALADADAIMREFEQALIKAETDRLDDFS